MSLLLPNQSLIPGQSIRSPNGHFTLVMQTDGNVVVYYDNNHPTWATNTHGTTNPSRLIMQDDGNLVFYDTNGSYHWASQTYGNPGAFLSMQDDGNLVVYRAGSTQEVAENALWAAGCNYSPSSGGGSGGGGAPNADIQAGLDLHNRCRAEFGSPPLSYSAELSAHAQSWANHLASANAGLVHGGGFEGEGQNLSWGSPSCSIADGVQMWINEKRFFRHGMFPDVSTTGNWADVGHYTQVVSRDTREVGFGIARGSDGEYVVCQYRPAGNMIGSSM